jgi:hypothetical protein
MLKSNVPVSLKAGTVQNWIRLQRSFTRRFLSNRLATILPLPEGEGQGEGGSFGDAKIDV